MTFAQQVSGQTPVLTATIRWHLLDPDGNRIGEVHPTRPGIEISNSTTSKKMRSLRGFHLGADEERDVHEFSDRLGPVWIDTEGTEHPLGVFLYADVNRMRHYDPAGDTHTLEGTHVDLGFILDQKLLGSLSYPAGTNLGRIMGAILDAYGITDRRIDACGLACSEPLAWAVGRDSGLDALGDVTVMASFNPPYFDNTGTCVLEAVPNVDGVAADFTYDPSGAIARDSIVESTNVTDAANVFLAVSSGSTGAPIVGRYDVDADLPWSLANRGFPVVETVDVQGLPSTASADDSARAAAFSSFGSFEPVAFDTIPDPRHDTFDIIDYLGELHMETAWTLPCDVGGSMGHTLRKLYVG